MPAKQTEASKRRVARIQELFLRYFIFDPSRESLSSDRGQRGSFIEGLEKSRRDAPERVLKTPTNERRARAMRRLDLMERQDDLDLNVRALRERGT